MLNSTVKIPTIVGIEITTFESLKARKVFSFQHFIFYGRVPTKIQKHNSMIFHDYP